PGASGAGPPGFAGCEAGADGEEESCRIERGLRSQPARIDSTRLVAKNAAARIAVVRVNTLDVPRLVRNPPPPPPMPSPPPSDFCSSTRPIMAETIMRWTTMMTVCIERSKAKGAHADVGHMGIRGRLYTIRSGISTGAANQR